MRRRTWTALGALVLALAAAYPVSKAGNDVAKTLFGLLVLVFLATFVALLPFWGRLPRLPPMPGLFQRAAGTWCATCGQHAPPGRPCPRCAPGKAQERKTFRATSGTKPRT